MLSLAIAHHDGIGTPVDNSKFYEWTRKAVRFAERAAGSEDRASEDLPNAKFTLAKAYRNGTGTRPNKLHSFNYLRSAAEAAAEAIAEPDIPRDVSLNLAPIFFDLAAAYRDGLGTATNAGLYFKWLMQSAEAGLPDAMVEAAVAYKRGHGTSTDKNKYIEWNLRAAQAGSGAGMYNLALAYATGEGTAYDPQEFHRWIRKAVENGHPDAFIALGLSQLAMEDLVDQMSVNNLLRVFKSLNDNVQSLLDDNRVKSIEAPEGVAHLTTLEALHSMLPETPEGIKKAHFLRLYNIAYVNDPQEGKTLWSNEIVESKLLREFVESAYVNRGDRILWEGQKFSVYVGSFTLDIDRLDLWRAYGRDGQGYCIVTPIEAFHQEAKAQRQGFVGAGLRAAFSEGGEEKVAKIPVTLYKIHYEKDKFKDAVVRLGSALRKIKRIKGKYSQLARRLQGEEAETKVARLIDQTVRAIVSDILFLYKHEEYKNEGEARVLAVFDISANVVRLDEQVPPRVYVETEPFLFESAGSQIIIGPRVREKMAALLNLQYRLARNGLDRTTHVRESSVPYQ